MDEPLARVRTLTFDLFGTVLDLTGSLVPTLERFFERKSIARDAEDVWTDWRKRQRLEQHQDTILMLGHRGYLDSAKRALRHTLRLHRVPHDEVDITALAQTFWDLQVFEDAQEALVRLADRYALVGLSNGDQRLVDHLVRERIEAKFSHTLSVDAVGRFKPHPSVYRWAAAELGHAPGEILMVAAHAFDVLGARACGYRGAYVDRYDLPYEDSPLVPDVQVRDFGELADGLLGA